MHSTASPARKESPLSTFHMCLAYVSAITMAFVTIMTTISDCHAQTPLVNELCMAVHVDDDHNHNKSTTSDIHCLRHPWTAIATGRTSSRQTSSDGQSSTTQQSLEGTLGACPRQQMVPWYSTQTQSTTSEASRDNSQWEAHSVSMCRGQHP